jgi:hypothetical protein
MFGMSKDLNDQNLIFWISQIFTYKNIVNLQNEAWIQVPNLH